jgi:hypothetical protein
VSPLCKLFGVTRQAYYKYDGSALMECVAREGFALEYMREIREKDPGIGILKLWYMYRRLFGPDHAVGRDRFGDIAERYGLKIRKKRRKPKTTDSRHGLPTYPDLTKELIPSRPNELWVSDITYITVGTDTWYRFCYLSLIMDAYTEEVIGWAVGDTLEAKLALEALRKALVRMEGGGPRARPIHHSDRGCQYASAEYVDMLRKSGVEISMTESGNPRGQRPCGAHQRHRQERTAQGEDVHQHAAGQGGHGNRRGVLQQREAAHEHRHDDARRGGAADRGHPEEVEELPRHRDTKKRTAGHRYP